MMRRALAGLRSAIRAAVRRRAGRWILRALVAGVVLVVAAWMSVRFTPESYWIEPFRFVRPNDSFEIVDRHGAVLRHARVDGVDRRWVELRDISPTLVDAFIAAEDARFRSHDGADGYATLRAAATMLRPWGHRSGASTITQQLVKLVYGRPYGSISKLVEIARAEALERTFSKDEIIEQYLNRVPFGDRIQGVERASEEYFGHEARELTVAEAAMLAGIPRAPSATEPRRHLERARRRSEYVLSRMAALGFIDEETHRRSAEEVVSIRAVPPRPNEAPRFADAVVARWRSGMVDRHDGAVRTSLDLALQRKVDAILDAAVERDSRRGVTNAAALVVANATGEILAYTGAVRQRGRGGSLDLLVRRRQPGSTLKPFVYELFFERGGTASTVLDDITLPRTGALGASFDAKDYDGRERGPVRARVALSASLNLAALDVAARVGQDALVGRLRALGFRGVESADHYGAAAVLGGLDVAPIDLAGAYVTLARGGTRVALSFAEGPPITGDRVMTAAACSVARDILSDPRARKEGFGADLTELAGGLSFALKTGTSSGWHDAWAATFDDSFTVVVWLGDPEGRPLAGVSGFEAAAPAAARILGAARSMATANLVIPAETSRERLVGVAVCAATGLRAGPSCTHVIQERFAPGSLPSETCEAHDEHGDVVLAPRYADWILRTQPTGVARSFLAPTATSEEPVVREPREGARFLVDSTRGPTLVPLHAWVGATEVHDVLWEVDGKPLGGAEWDLVSGDHTVVAEWKGHRSRPASVHVDDGNRAASRR